MALLLAALAALLAGPPAAAGGPEPVCGVPVVLPERIVERNEGASECSKSSAFLKGIEDGLPGKVRSLRAAADGRGGERALEDGGKDEGEDEDEDTASEQHKEVAHEDGGNKDTASEQHKEVAHEDGGNKEEAPDTTAAPEPDTTPKPATTPTTPRPAAEEAAGGLEEQLDFGQVDELPPDCRHEIGVKLMWSYLRRADLHGTQVADGVQYWASLYRAPPSAIRPTMTYGLLRNVTLHVPGLHFFGKHRMDGEIHLVHEGRAPHWSHAEVEPFTVVIPIMINYAWDAEPHPALEFLSKSSTWRPVCADWSFRGTAYWITNGFTCPGFRLEAKRLLERGDRALHYNIPGGCRNTFVVSESIQVSGAQVEAVADRIQHPPSDFANLEQPREIVVASALRSFEEFTVFSRSEIYARQLIYVSIMTGGIVLVAFIFMVVRRISNTYEIEMADFISEAPLPFNLCLDHWVCYLASLLIPWVSYFNGASNSKTGMPYEYDLALFAVFILHMAHELVMFAQVGGAVKRLSYLKVARLSILSIMGLVHTMLFIQFSLIALMHGSGLAWCSIITFLFCNIFGQLVLLSMNAPPDLIFKARSFEVLHAVLTKRLKDYVKAGTYDDKFKSREVERSKHGGISDSAVEGTFTLLSSVGDLLQCVYMVIFMSTHGSSPVVTYSLCLSFFYVLWGAVRNWVPSLDSLWDPPGPSAE